MGRLLRYIPLEGSLVELTSRVTQGRFLLRPSSEVNALIVDVVGRAQRKYEVSIVAMAWMSTHFHMLVQAVDARQVASFMRDVKSQIAKGLGAILDWPAPVWGRRYSMSVISEEPEAQLDRLRYCLSQGVKEGLVSRVEDWPGVHCSPALLQDRVMSTTQDGDSSHKGSGTEITLAKIPCWAHLTDDQYREAVRELIRSIEEEADAEHRVAGTRPVGQSEILKRNPRDRVRLDGTPLPQFLTFRREVREILRQSYSLFEDAYRAAADRLRQGMGEVRFPVGSFPSPMPFVTPAQG